MGLSQLILDALRKGITPLESMERESQLKSNLTHLKSKSSHKSSSLPIVLGDGMCHQRKYRVQRSIVFVNNFKIAVCGHKIYNRYTVRKCIRRYLFFSWKIKILVYFQFVFQWKMHFLHNVKFPQRNSIFGKVAKKDVVCTWGGTSDFDTL